MNLREGQKVSTVSVVEKDEENTNENETTSNDTSEKETKEASE